ncbi:ATP-grasp domain-containing protein [Vibrio sp. 1075]|uniref:ATP-grasp domain-containing protein n=1 Tax=Vibrio sp. 1075 TaxID=3074543 RepID=UPI002964C51A|nr:ATP-grasp domain-containing protein [Vibrio sp. 1075]MDW2309496.1 ATP-grasp domain-containing protein [Vibrio sp. 1075]
MNVLLTSAGRRSYLVEYFRKALDGKGLVVTTNSVKNAPSAYVSDKFFLVEESSAENYINTILKICTENNIEILCSLHDLDSFILSKHQDLFDELGIKTTLPSKYWGRLSLDKYECNKLLREEGLSVPWSSVSLEETFQCINKNEVKFPLICKARAGFGSLGLKVCYSKSELSAFHKSISQELMKDNSSNFIDLPPNELVVIEEFIEGQEFCVGIVNDFEGKYKSHFLCEIHGMRAGESDSATSRNPMLVDSLAKTFSSLTRHKGIWGVDCIERNGEFFIIDVNPRFTGDYPFHHLAGADIPKALLYWADGKSAPEECFDFNVDMLGYKDLVPTLVRG